MVKAVERDFGDDEWVHDELDANEDSLVSLDPLEAIDSVDELVELSASADRTLVLTGRWSFFCLLIAFKQLSISCVISKNVFTRSDNSLSR